MVDDPRKHADGDKADRPATNETSPHDAVVPNAVGYKRPPAGHRFPKGTSGNIRGRPSGSRSFKTELREVLELKIPVTENGAKTKMTARKAMLVRLRQQALGGDGRAIDRLLKLAMSHLPDEVESDDGRTAREDKALLAVLLAELGLKNEGGNNDR